jgi:hypothetical protein
MSSALKTINIFKGHNFELKLYFSGLGYALLAHVPPVVGIYMAFFPMIPYFFLGTSRHNSMGKYSEVNLCG